MHFIYFAEQRSEERESQISNPIKAMREMFCLLFVLSEDVGFFPSAPRRQEFLRQVSFRSHPFDGLTSPVTAIEPRQQLTINVPLINH